jgi:tRNA1(Val) A37 N6-methylase TrmN6
MEHKIEQLSISYTNDVDKTYLSKFGQFFTINKILLEKLIDKNIKPKRILEPSFGTGRIIVECLKFYSGAIIDAVEIDNVLYNKTKKEFKSITNVNLINKNFLEFKTSKKYDLIIGNPPYFETTDYNKEEYKEITCGRMNIYSLFIYKCIKLLNENGILRFIIPSSILSSKSFELLRKYIIKHTEVVDIIKFNDTGLFEKVSQNVIILVLKKQKNTGKNVVNINGRIVFTKNNFKPLLSNSTTIKKMNAIVSTGNIEWNKYRSNLKSTKSETRPLIRSNCILSMKLTNENRSKLIKEPCILVNRIININNPVLNVRYIKEPKEIFVENHINVITGKNLNKIYKSLISSKTHKFLKEFVSNTQVSQDELQNIIPILT